MTVPANVVMKDIKVNILSEGKTETNPCKYVGVENREEREIGGERGSKGWKWIRWNVLILSLLSFSFIILFSYFCIFF